MSVPSPRTATVVRITADTGEHEVYRLQFDFGDESFLRWAYFQNLGSKRVQTTAANRPLGSAEEMPNTWAIYTEANGDTTHEYRLRLTDEEFALWLADCESQEGLPAMGSGRRASRVQKLQSWRERQKRPAKQLTPAEAYERLRQRR